jgi:hypothetical protein
LQSHQSADSNPPGSSVRLSKSKIAAYEICPRRFWLQIHRPSLRQFDAQTLRIFDAGHLVGELARARYPSGVLVSEGPREIDAALARTAELIHAPVQRPIFEGAFMRDNVIIRADILEPDSWGAWKLAEIKNSSSVKNYQLADVASQSWVLTGNNICLSSVIIRHVQRSIRSVNSIPRVRFIDADVTLNIRSLVASRQRLVNEAKLVAQGAEPAIEPGPQCVRPFRCEYRHHCGAAVSQQTSAITELNLSGPV